MTEERKEYWKKRLKKDADFRVLVRRLILIAVSALFVSAVAIFDAVRPFRTLLPSVALPERLEGEARIHFLDVGQGDATIVEFPSGDVLLVDAGDGSFSNDNKIYRYLKGIDPVHLTIAVTHPDIDHCGGVENVIKNFEVERVLLPVYGSDNGFYLKMLKACKGIPTETLSRYRSVRDSSGAYVVCVSPASLTEASENDASSVLYVNYEGVETLLGADISSVAERMIMREYALLPGIFDSGDLHVDLGSIEILKVSHHGSAASSCEQWLTFLGAEVAVISCGAGNSYGHPSADAVMRLAQHSEIYRTDELGDIVVTIRDGAYRVQYESARARGGER